MNKREPLVSILMPYFRLGEYLLEAVESVKGQTYSNWELIIVDDCSPENPAAQVLADETDRRIQVFCHDSNKGAAAARNTAAANSSGEYLIPLDSDDRLAPTYIEKTLRAAMENDASAAYTHVQYFGGWDRIYIPLTDLGEIFAGHFPCNTLLVKRELFDLVGGYKNLNLIEDTEFWITIIETGAKFAVVPEPLYFYRNHEKGLTGTQSQNILVSFYRVLLMHHQSVAEHVQRVLEMLRDLTNSRVQNAYRPDLEFNVSHDQIKRRESEYAHLNQEFEILKKRHISLSQRVERNEEMLGNIPSITRQMAYITLKRLGLR